MRPLLDKLLRAVARQLQRWVLVVLGPAAPEPPIEPAIDELPPAPPLRGPPAHWVELVRHAAPELLQGLSMQPPALPQADARPKTRPPPPTSPASDSPARAQPQASPALDAPVPERTAPGEEPLAPASFEALVQSAVPDRAEPPDAPQAVPPSPPPPVRSAPSVVRTMAHWISLAPGTPDPELEPAWRSSPVVNADLASPRRLPQPPEPAQEPHATRSSPTWPELPRPNELRTGPRTLDATEPLLWPALRDERGQKAEDGTASGVYVPWPVLPEVPVAERAPEPPPSWPELPWPAELLAPPPWVELLRERERQERLDREQRGE